jgi:tetratricopeptide (TPR) repeat protein
MTRKNTEGLGGLKAWALALLFLAAAWGCERAASRARKAAFKLPFAFSQEVPAGLSRFSLVGALAGMRTVAADWVYIDALQYYGAVQNRLDGRYRRLDGMARELLWLDPYFHFAVQWAAAVLCWNVERPSQAVDLLKRAVTADPGHPRYQQYLAAIAYEQGRFVPQTLGLLERLVQEPERSEILLRTLGNLYLKYGMWAKVRPYWTWVESVSDDPRTLELARAAEAEAVRHGY